jgi:hypothetical protein
VDDDELGYPVTITAARYGGIYEPGRWVAFACLPEDLPPDWNADDVSCLRFYETCRDEIGGGSTPQEAYADLARLMRNRRTR